MSASLRVRHALRGAQPLHGRVAIVTGATGLLGAQHCRALACAGATVIAADLDAARSTDLAAALQHEMGDGGGRVMGYALDVTSEASVDALAAMALERFGGVDVLVNNAAINDKVEGRDDDLARTRVESYPLDLWNDMLQVNVTGVFLCCRRFGGEMASAGRGSIINIASTYAMVAPDPSLYQRADGSQRFFKSVAYPASKGAVLALTRALAAYWGGCGVRVNSLSPGGVENGQDDHFVGTYARRTPLGRMSKLGDLDGALLFLAGDGSAYVTGHNLVVDGGWTAW